MDILALTQRVSNSIILGESHFREFKSAFEGKPDEKRPRSPKSICQDIGEALVAFANADGGELLVGVEDDGEITGVPFSTEVIGELANAFKTHVHHSTIPLMQYNSILDINGKKVLYFSVSKGSSSIFQLPDGRCVRRQDKSTVPMNVNQVLIERQEQLSREYDRDFVEGATTTDLDIQLIRAIADQYIKGMSPEQYLQQIGLAEYSVGGLVLRRAALLLFAKDIHKWAPRSQVRIIQVSGDRLESGEKYNVISDEYVTGNIFFLLKQAWDMLRPYLASKTELSNAALFEQRYVYPELACREALINAIAHRDYLIQNGIEIYIYTDRLEVKSPGQLLSTVKLEDIVNLHGVHESRNSNISKVLRENQFMRELGEGIRRIYELMAEQELSKPAIVSTNNSFSITLYHKSSYSKPQQDWLKMFNSFLLDSNQKKIVVLGMNEHEISMQDIFEALNTTDRNVYDKTITSLRTSGILVKTKNAIQVKNLAQRKGIQKQHIGRYKVIIPNPEKHYEEEVVPNKVFVYNIPITSDAAMIISALSIFGKVVDVKMPINKETGLSNGYCFVTFDNSESALRAISIRNVKIGDIMAVIYAYRNTNH